MENFKEVSLEDLIILQNQIKNEIEARKTKSKVIVDIEAHIGDKRVKYTRSWKKWAKILTGIDDTKSNGFCFLGSFIKVEGKFEPEIGSKILVYVEYGSAKNHQPYVYLFNVTLEGLEELYFKECQYSWALEVRDEIKNLI